MHRVQIFWREHESTWCDSILPSHPGPAAPYAFPGPTSARRWLRVCHQQRPDPHFWTSASFLQVNKHCPTRWQHSSQLKILLTFRYLTNINTEESQCLFTISPLFLKNTSLAAPDAVSNKVQFSKLLENWDQAAPIDGFSCHFGPSNIAKCHGPKRFDSKWPLDTHQSSEIIWAPLVTEEKYFSLPRSCWWWPGLTAVCQACVGEGGQQTISAFWKIGRAVYVRSHSIHPSPWIVWWCVSPFPVTKRKEKNNNSLHAGWGSRKPTCNFSTKLSKRLCLSSKWSQVQSQGVLSPNSNLQQRGDASFSPDPAQKPNLVLTIREGSSLQTTPPKKKKKWH